jgi:predicted transposase YbfD/YdcC
VIKITSPRESSGKSETEERFYISSLKPDNDFNKFIRNHWAVENKLHSPAESPRVLFAPSGVRENALKKFF